MSQNFMEAFGEQANNVCGPVTLMSEVMLRNAEQLVEHSLTALKVYAELGMSQMRALAEVKDAQSLSDFHAKQVKWFNELSQQMLQDTQCLSEIGNRVRGDIADVVGGAYSVTAANVTPIQEAGKQVIKVASKLSA